MSNPLVFVSQGVSATEAVRIQAFVWEGAGISLGNAMQLQDPVTGDVLFAGKVPAANFSLVLSLSRPIPAPHGIDATVLSGGRVLVYTEF